MSAVMRVSNLASDVKMTTDLVSVSSKASCKTVTYDATNSKYSYHVGFFFLNDICLRALSLCEMLFVPCKQRAAPLRLTC